MANGVAMVRINDAADRGNYDAVASDLGEAPLNNDIRHLSPTARKIHFALTATFALTTAAGFCLSTPELFNSFSQPVRLVITGGTWGSVTALEVTMASLQEMPAVSKAAKYAMRIFGTLFSSIGAALAAHYYSRYLAIPIGITGTFLALSPEILDYCKRRGNAVQNGAET